MDKYIGLDVHAKSCTAAVEWVADGARELLHQLHRNHGDPRLHARRARPPRASRLGYVAE